MEVIALGSNWTFTIMIFAMIKFNQRSAEVQEIKSIYAGQTLCRTFNFEKKRTKNFSHFSITLRVEFRHSVL